MTLSLFDERSVAAHELAPLARLNHEDVPVYHFRRKLMSRVVTLTLGPSSLLWSDGLNDGEVSYADMVTVRMRYEPGHLFLARFWLEIEPRKARPVRFANWGWRGLGEIDTQNDAYRGFLGALHEKLRPYQAQTAFVAGERAWRHGLALIVGVLAVLALVGLMVKVAALGGLGPLAILAACLAFFGWQTWQMVSRNRPARYGPEALPLRLLPPAETDH